MKRPVCPICYNKVKDNRYLWDFERKALVHQSCYKLNQKIKDVLVTVEPLRLYSKAVEPNTRKGG